jgi:hypothetical protein
MATFDKHTQTVTRPAGVGIHRHWAMLLSALTLMSATLLAQTPLTSADNRINVPVRVDLGSGNRPAALTACGTNVGYYDTSTGQGEAYAVAPIVAAGLTPIQLFNLTAAELATVDVIVVYNPNNGSPGAEFLARTGDIANAVQAGKVLIMHDRNVSQGMSASQYLPGGLGISFTFNLSANIQVLNPASILVNGPGGIVTNTNLDSGNSSNHGYATLATLPAGANAILSDGGPTRIVTFSYPFGSGSVIYSSIPLDFYLAGSGNNPPRDNLRNIYTVNAMAYGMSLVSCFTPAPTMSLVDPLACNGPGDLVNGSASVTNTSAVAQMGTLTTALPAGLVGIPGTCVSNIAACTVTATTVSWSGMIPAGQTLTYNYQAQIGNSVVNGQVLTATTTATFGAQSGTAAASLTVNCSALGPGLPAGPDNAVSDQKPGSILAYPIYTSDAANGASQNARVAITNTNPTRTAFVHLFFVDGSSCSVADSYICLTANQTASILASDVDPGTTGYVIAVATNAAGCPISFNYLIGDEYVKFASGHQANLGAEAIGAVAGGPTTCGDTTSEAALNFNNVNYTALPRVLAASNLPARGDGNDTLLIVNRIGGSLSTNAATLGTLFGILYDDAERAYSFSLPASTCQLRSSLNNDRPRTVPRYDQVIGSGRSGWLKVSGGTDIGIFGAQINRNTNAASNAGAFNQGHNLHKLTFTTTQSVTIPVFPPTC